MSEQGRVYPAGTEVRKVRQFDRSQKVVFQCPNHMEFVYRSKDPYSSTWFPATRTAAESSECQCSASSMVIVEEYRPFPVRASTRR